MGAHDDAAYPWLADVKDADPVRGRRRPADPGICLGHQLAAVALGGEVRRNPRGQQIGLFESGGSGGGDDPLFGAVATAAPGGALEPRRGHRVARRAWRWRRRRPASSRRRGTRRGLGCAVASGGRRADLRGVGGARPRATDRLGVDTDRLLLEVADARAELATAWKPLGAGFAKLAAVLRDDPARSRRRRRRADPAGLRGRRRAPWPGWRGSAAPPAAPGDPGPDRRPRLRPGGSR